MSKVAKKAAPDAKKQVVEALHQAISETAVETVKAQNFHWNVEGMAFGPLHELFQKIYEDHFEAQDELGERVKALGEHADGRFSTFLKRSTIAESDGKISAKKMVEELASDQEQLSATMIALAELADTHGDLVTNDMAIGRAQVHDKFAWMLRAHLAD